MSAPPGDCQSIGELLGAYALDALDTDEHALVSAHLAGCPRCAAEVAQHRETIGLVAASGGNAPEGVWERISQAIDDGTRNASRQAPPLPSLRRTSRRTDRWRKPMAALAAAAAAAVIALVGVQTVRVDHLDHQVRQLNAAARQAGGFQGAAAALVDPSARHLQLTSTRAGSRTVGELVLLPSGAAYLVGANLPSLAETSTYQLWSIVAGRAVSVGVLGAHPATVAFTVDPAAPSREFLVTVEPAGGVVAPTSAPVARAAV